MGSRCPVRDVELELREAVHLQWLLNIAAGNQGINPQDFPKSGGYHVSDVIETSSFQKARECNSVDQALFTPQSSKQPFKASIVVSPVYS